MSAYSRSEKPHPKSYPMKRTKTTEASVLSALVCLAGKAILAGIKEELVVPEAYIAVKQTEFGGKTPYMLHGLFHGKDDPRIIGAYPSLETMLQEMGTDVPIYELSATLIHSGKTEAQ